MKVTSTNIMMKTMQHTPASNKEKHLQPSIVLKTYTMKMATSLQSSTKLIKQNMAIQQADKAQVCNRNVLQIKMSKRKLLSAKD